MSRLILIAGLTALVSGCSLFGWFDSKGGPMKVRGPEVVQVVTKLPSVELPDVRMPPPTREEVMSAYRRVYGVVADPRDNHAVGKRLADLEMQVGEERDAAGEAAPYQAAIALYEDLLKQPDAEDLDQIIYQLARAYDVVGNGASSKHYLDRLVSEYPGSDRVVGNDRIHDDEKAVETQIDLGLFES